jgi:tetratricopeptide (TPR) repeat protein
MVWLRVRLTFGIGLAMGIALAFPGCSGATDPEKPENSGNPAVRQPAPGDDTSLALTDPPANVQSMAELQRLAEEAEKKIAPLRHAAESDPTNAEKQHALGRALYDANFKEQAVVHLERAAEMNPSVRTLLDLALGYSGAARLEDAERTSERLLALSPGFSIALHNLGTLAYRRGEYEKAVTYFNRALESEPDYLLARLHAGDSFKASGRLQEAYRNYEQVLELEPSNSREASGYVEALYKMAALDLKMGAYERSGQLLTELLRMAPDHNRAYYAYGQVLLHLGRTEEAQQAFDKHVQILAAEKIKSPVAMGD